MLKEYIKAHEGQMLKTWQDLHAMPEWGQQEFKTSAYLKKALQEQGITTIDMGPTGFIAEITGAEPGPIIGLRADMDALPYRNEAGETYYVHACGHDSHSTMGLWTMLALKELGLVRRGTVRALFQPDEEGLSGAVNMAKAGAIKAMDELYGVHIRPIQELPFGKASPALWHGASTGAEIIVHGTAAHGARPHLGANAIDGAAAIIFAINSIWMDPGQPWSAKVTRIQGGGDVVNIIPDKAVLSVDVRSASNKLMKELLAKIGEAAQHAAASMGCTCEFKPKHTAPAAEYDQVCIDALALAITEALGAENLFPPIITVGADDFHEYKVADPTLKTGFLALGADAEPGLHSPDMHFNTACIFKGVAILTTALASRVK